MIRKVDLESVYEPSEDVVAREIEGVIIIVPIVSGIADIEDELFSLNETGKAIWLKLDGHRSLREVVEALLAEFEAPVEEVREDVVGLVSELLRRRMVAQVSAK